MTAPALRCRAPDEGERVERRLRAVGHAESVAAVWAARLRRLADRYAAEALALRDADEALDALWAAVGAEELAADLLVGWRPVPDRRRVQAGEIPA